MDRFADDFNTKLTMFNSRFFSPGAESIDAFASNWKYEYNYLVPPLYLIPRVIKYLEFCEGIGILVVSYWRASYFWPCVSRHIMRSDSSVVDNMWLGNIFMHGRNKKSLFGSKYWRGSSLALKFD